MQANIHEAKTHLSKLIRYALEGEEVVIAKGNRALVRLEVPPRRTRAASPRHRTGADPAHG